jgi:arylsulfatase A-like enzyme
MLSCNGNPNLNTPHLDRLAVEGQNYHRAVSGFPLCCPFRGSLLTSRYPHECVPGHEYRMPSQMPTVAHAFQEHGFETAYFGKWHVDGFHEREGRAAMHIIPPERRGGFDTWVGYENNNSQWDCWVHGGEGEQAFHYRLPGYETDCLADLLIDYIRQQGAARRNGERRPFFAILSVQPPHNPYLAPAEWMARHTPRGTVLRPNVPPVGWIQDQARRDLAGAYAMTENLDWNLGRIRQTLIEDELDLDTNLIFFSDHGDLHGSHGQFKKTAPWEEAIRVPFLIGGLHPRYEGRTGWQPYLVNHVDIAPTTLGL